MTTLHLIRHGRAQALAEDYDQLHEVGELQARLLGAHLARNGQRFDAVYVGPLRRQRETVRWMRHGAADRASWPVEQVLDSLAEGPFELLFKKYLFARMETDPVIKGHVARLRDAPDEREAITDLIFVHMIGLWTRAEIAGDDLETAAGFEARVDAALAHILEREGPGRQVAVVTSNGVIGACARRALGVMEAPLRSAGAEPSMDGRRMRVHNASVTCIERTATGLALRAHDVLEHLPDPGHHTLL